MIPLAVVKDKLTKPYSTFHYTRSTWVKVFCTRHWPCSSVIQPGITSCELGDLAASYGWAGWVMRLNDQFKLKTLKLKAKLFANRFRGTYRIYLKLLKEVQHVTNRTWRHLNLNGLRPKFPLTLITTPYLWLRLKWVKFPPNILPGMKTWDP